MNILIGITGGISAYKVLDVISLLRKQGHEVHVIMTDNAHYYCPPEAVNVISGGNLKIETPDQTLHIDEAKWCDVFALVPATANTIAKIAHGMADNFLTSTILALPPDKIKIVSPAMNTNMYETKFTQDNLDKLADADFRIIYPVVGMLACGDYGDGKLRDPKDIVQHIIGYSSENIWEFPLRYEYRGTTIDSYSFLDYDWTKNAEINLYPHVGSFGVRRRHDVHKGIDIYAKLGDTVHAVENGIVVEVCPFTGPSAGFPWWEDTIAVYVEGKTGIVVYGELKETKLKIGSFVDAGGIIGTIGRVLKNDKGRPLSMLHLELHAKGYIHTKQWKIGQEKPEGLLDPTPYLITSFK